MQKVSPGNNVVFVQTNNRKENTPEPPSPPSHSLSKPPNRLRRYENHIEPNYVSKKYREEMNKKMEKVLVQFQDAEAVERTLKIALKEDSVVRVSDFPFYIDRLQVQLKEARDRFGFTLLTLKTDALIMSNWKCQFTPSSRNGRRLNLCHCKSTCPVKFLIHATLFITSAEDGDFESMKHHLDKSTEYV